MYIAISAAGVQLQAASLNALISKLKLEGDTGTYTVYREIATVLRAPEVLVLPKAS
jgi:hypothetical protein